MTTSPNPWFLKRFSVGCSLISMSLTEWKDFIDKYHPYIYDVYFSPPIPDYRFSSRPAVFKEFLKEENRIQIFEALDYAKEKGIKLEYAINTVHITPELATYALDIIEDKIEIDSVVTLGHVADIVKERHPKIDLIYAYNNIVRSKRDIDEVPSSFDEVVVGNSGIRNFKLFSYIKEKGFRVRWMPNNGCSFNCAWCGTPGTCTETFDKNLEKHGGDYLFALQSISPWEMHDYFVEHPDIDIIKLSTRPSPSGYLHSLMESYLFNLDYKEMKSRGANPRYLWGRMGLFSKVQDEMDFEKVNEYKQKIWSSIYSKK